jgi:hypothetical protein
MIALRRTTRDGAWFALPILTLLTSATSYALYSQGLGAATADKSLTLITILLILLCFLSWYIYRLLRPISYITRVLEDRIVLHTSLNPNDDTILMRSDIRQLFTESPPWNADDIHDLKVIAERYDDTLIPLDLRFVTGSNASRLYDAIVQQWGTQYVPTHTHQPEDAADIQAMRRNYARRLSEDQP